jgi:sphingosine kinase
MEINKGLIIVNSNCSSNKTIEKMVRKIYNKNEVGLIYSKDQNELNNVFDNQDYVIVVGGDGTVFSVLQLVYGKDITIGHLPTGTGNGLTNSLLNMKNMKITSDLTPVYNNLMDAIEERRVQEIDTLTIKLLNSGKTIHSFLFLSCGLFANLDIKSEWLRFMGEFRFTIGAIWELVKYPFCGNSFNGTLEYENDEGDIVKVEGNFVFFLASNLSHTSGSSITSPLSRPDDGYVYLSYLIEPTSTWNILNLLLGMEDGSYIKRLSYIRTKWFKLEPEQGIFDIDGEVFDIEPVEVSVNPKSLKVFI